MKSNVDAECYLSVIAPLHNDSDIVDGFVTELAGILSGHFANYEIVLVDDGSSDATVDRVSELMTRYERIRLIRLSRPFGQEIAISAGLDSVIGDFVVVMLPDSDPPALVPALVDRAQTGAEIVFGIRKSRRDDPLFLRIGAALFYWYCNRVLRLDLPKDSTHFRVLSRRAVNALTRIKDRGRYLRTLSQHVGYRSQAFPYDLAQRRSHPRKKSPIEAVELAVDIIVTNSRRPLRMVSWLAVLLAVANAGYAVQVVAFRLAGEGPGPGYTASAIQLGLAFAFLFSILAVLCEYVGRVVDESKGRPLYYVMEEKNSSVLLLDEAQRNIVDESTER